MENPTVLWIGTNQKRCLTLMELYSDVICSVYVENAEQVDLKEQAKKIAALILVLDCGERADTAACRAVYSFSAKRHIPAYLMGQPHHLHAALMICPSAMLSPIVDNEIAAVFSEGAPAKQKPSSQLPAVAAFSDLPEYFAYLDERIEPELQSAIRLICCEPERFYADRLKKNGVKPKLFVFSENVLGGDYEFFPACLFKQAGLRRVPYLILGASDKLPETAWEGTKPLAAIDIRKEPTRLNDCIRQAVGKR